MKCLLRTGVLLGFVISITAPLSLLFAQKADAPPAKPDIRFNRDIRAILSNRCFKCHGPDLKKAGLDLQSREGATAVLKSGDVAIVPGKSSAGQFLQRITTADEKEQMPPKGKGDRLTEAEIARLKAWIDAGAQYEEHWAYVKPQRPALPTVKNAGWARNDLDRFILARLEQEGLAPSAEAERATLIRRVSLDLIGLPPTVAEVDAFLADTDPKAYEKVVDRLLDSRHYGERQARPWLDLARYADTNGYEKDDRRTIWPYRDWVINVFNLDLPFDQFTIEQLAGDLLPNATLQQKVATGFHRNTMVNTEGGIDDEEFRIAAVVDRVNTTAAVWLGSTFACAQCHNHKFDPFSQKEYYQFFAFFNNTADRGGSNEPSVPIMTAEETVKRDKLRAEIANAQKVLDTQTPELDIALAKWEAMASNQTATWKTLEPTKFESANGATLTKQADGSILVSGTNPEKDVYRIEAATDLKGITGLRIEVLPHDSLPTKGPGRAGNGNFVLSELRVKAAATAEPDKGLPIVLQHATADFAQESWAVAGAIDGNPATGWAISPQIGKEHVAVFETKQDVGGDGGTILSMTLEQNFGGQHNIGRFRISTTTAPRPVRLGGLPDAVVKLIAVPASERNEQQKAELAKYYRTIAPELVPARKHLGDLKKQEAAVKPVTAMVLQEIGQPRATHIMIRGNHKNFGDKVTAAFPVKLQVAEKTDASPAPALNRLDLARWLVDPNNPLTSRVTMNRIWAQHFGRGLVETGEDFGVQGEMPTHPELLDWLATELLRQRWSVKAMHRLIVTSASYRQSSRVTPQLHERDQFNRLLARGPRFRLEAEQVRDNALAISGLLSPKIGGPSVFPYQPEGVWSNPYSGDKWTLSVNGDQYRRGLYTFWRRTAPYAAFMSFDAPSREICTERRPRTNTPLQALATLNDRGFVECAAALSRRIMTESKGTDKERAILGFRLCVSRKPSDAELNVLLKLFAENLEKYKKDPVAAKAMAANGTPLPAGMDAAELAAWTVIANVLLNLDEAITQG